MSLLRTMISFSRHISGWMQSQCLKSVSLALWRETAWLGQNQVEQVQTEIFFFNPLVKSHTQMTQQIEKFANVFKKKWMKKYLIFIYIFFFELVSKGSGKALNVSSSSLKSSNSLFVPGAQGTDSSLVLKYSFFLFYLDLFRIFQSKLIFPV